jgi:hypothetical protein
MSNFIEELVKRIVTLEKRVAYLETCESTRIYMLSTSAFVVDNQQLDDQVVYTTAVIRGNYGVSENASGIFGVFEAHTYLGGGTQMQVYFGDTATTCVYQFQRAPDSVAGAIEGTISGFVMVPLNSTDGCIRILPHIMPDPGVGESIMASFNIVGYWE